MAAKPARKKTIAPSEMDPAFAVIAEAFRGDEKISLARMFGSEGLKINGKVFIMLVKGDLVAKLPKERVTALISARVGEHFDPGHGRLMKEWVAVEPASATNVANYAMDNGMVVASAVFGASARSLILTTTTPLVRGTTYTVTVNNVRDTSAARNVILANSQHPVAIRTLKNRQLSPLAELFCEQVRAFTKPLAKA